MMEIIYLIPSEYSSDSSDGEYIYNLLELLFAFSALTLLVGRQEGHLACKKTEWWGAGVVVCLERSADLNTAQLMPLPLTLTVSYFSKIQIGFTFLVPAHPGSPGKRAIKRARARARVRACVALISVTIVTNMCLQCFDAVGWAAGRASGL